MSKGAEASQVSRDSDICLQFLAPVANAAAEALTLTFGCVDIVRSLRNDLPPARIFTSSELGPECYHYQVLEVNSGAGLAGYLNQHPEERPQLAAIYREGLALAFS